MYAFLFLLTSKQSKNIDLSAFSAMNNYVIPRSFQLMSFFRSVPYGNINQIIHTNSGEVVNRLLPYLYLNWNNLNSFFPPAKLWVFNFAVSPSCEVRYEKINEGKENFLPRKWRDGDKEVKKDTAHSCKRTLHSLSSLNGSEIIHVYLGLMIYIYKKYV